MQKKALVLAVGTALIATAGWAQKKPEPDSVVELYGKVYPELVFPSSSGATSSGTATCTICDPAAGENSVIKRTEMESSNSRFGVRGHEKVGPNLKATFQFETQFLVDNAGTRFAERDSWVGLTHAGWGTVKLGRFDTPFKDYGDDVSFLGVSSGNFTSTSDLYRHIGFGSRNNAARFHERRVNAVQYESPDLGPIDFKIQYSNNENRTATRNPEVYSAGLQYEIGPFAVLVGYEEHRDLFGLSLNAPTAMRNNSDPLARSKDRAMAVAVKYKIGNHQFEIDANEKKYEETGTGVTGRVRSYKNNAYLFVWDARWSQQWRTAFHYVKASAGKCTRVNEVCNTNGLGAEQFALGVAYHFSRRTYLFLMGTYVKNDFSAVFSNSNLQDVNPGEDITQIGIGIHTSF